MKKKRIVGLVDQSNIKNQPHLFLFLVFNCWLHCDSMEDFFFQVAVERGLRPFLKTLPGSSLLFSSASLGRKSSFSTCRE